MRCLVTRFARWPGLRQDNTGDDIWVGYISDTANVPSGVCEFNLRTKVCDVKVTNLPIKYGVYALSSDSIGGLYIGLQGSNRIGGLVYRNTAG